MKRWRDQEGPFGIRLHFDPGEFEIMMDDLRERAGPGVFCEGNGIDVDRVLMKALTLEADYVDLPEGVLGRTLFGRDGRARIEVCRRLAEQADRDETARRRLRTTMAHEGGHVACHQQLFLEDARTPSLFPEGELSRGHTKILCRDERVGDLAYRGEWWEYQANQCMAYLLLPSALFRARLKDALRSRDAESFEEVVQRGAGLAVVHDLSTCFDVSKEMVFYRLKAMGVVPNSREPKLLK